MPAINIKKEGNILIGLWDISENADELLSDLYLDNESTEHLAKITHEGRKKHWLAYRQLIKTLIGRDYILKYSEFGKPFIVDFSGYISVSHSGKYAAVIIGENPVGVDVEKISPRILKVQERFMSRQEIDSISESESPDKFYVYWSSKEALHKLYGDQNFEFNKELIINNFKFSDKGLITAHIENESINENRVINYERIDDYMLAWL
jgi:phosphopantetheinyl transferase